MLNRLEIRFAFFITLLLMHPLLAGPQCFGQKSPTFGAATTEQPSSIKQVPFDRLELLAFIAGTFSSQYVAHEINNSGISFVPDATFLHAVQALNRGPGIIEAINSAKRRGDHVVSSQREAAYKLVLIAVDDIQKKRYDAAAEMFQRALKLAPDSAALHLAYGGDLLMIQKYVPAEEQYRLSLQLWPENADAHVLLSTSLIGQNRESEAVAEAREGLRIFPSHKAALVALAMSLTKSRRYSEAIPVLREATTRTPEMPVLRKDLGVSLFHSGDNDGAIEELIVFTESQPNDAEGHYYLGAALRAKGRVPEAQVQFKEAASIEPNNPVYAAVADPDAREHASADSSGPRPSDGFFSENVYTNTFFGFSYEFPKRWKVLRSDAGAAIARRGATIMANGDATLQDAAEAAVANAYSLLVVAEGMRKDGTPGTRSVQIHALNRRVSPNLKSAEEFANDLANLDTIGGRSAKVVGTPEELSVAGRIFWRVNLTTEVDGAVAHGAEIVTLDRDFVLMFVFSSPDTVGLEEIAQTIQSLRFLETSK